MMAVSHHATRQLSVEDTLAAHHLELSPHFPDTTEYISQQLHFSVTFHFDRATLSPSPPVNMAANAGPGQGQGQSYYEFYRGSSSASSHSMHYTTNQYEKQPPTAFDSR